MSRRLPNIDGRLQAKLRDMAGTSEITFYVERGSDDTDRVLAELRIGENHYAREGVFVEATNYTAINNPRTVLSVLADKAERSAKDARYTEAARADYAVLAERLRSI